MDRGKVDRFETFNSSIASAYMWLSRFGHPAEPVVPQMTNWTGSTRRERRGAFTNGRPVRNRGVGCPDKKKTAAVTKQRARRKIWWRGAPRSKPTGSYAKRLPAAGDRAQPSVTLSRRSGGASLPGGFPSASATILAAELGPDAEFERLEGLVEHVGVIAADRQRRRRLLREEAAPAHLRSPIGAREAGPLEESQRVSKPLTNATCASPSGLYPATWSHHCAPECRTPWQRDLRLADVRWNPTFIGGPSPIDARSSIPPEATTQHGPFR